jgi:hypothetical protein
VHNNITSFAILPGFPKPLQSGPHYDAEKAYVQAHGLHRPILVDHAGQVWSGRTLANICFELGIEPIIRVVENGQAAAVQELSAREYSPLEWADVVRSIHDDPSTNFVLGDAPKRSIAVSKWFRTYLGKERGFSPSQIEQYLRVARSSRQCRDAVKCATSLHQAMRIMKQLDAKAGSVAQPQAIDVIPGDKENGAMNAAAAFMEAMYEVKNWTAHSLDTLRGLRRLIDRTLRVHRSVAKDIAA